MKGEPRLQEIAGGPLAGMERPGDPRSPTAVLLHGYGGDEKVMWIFSEAIPSTWTVRAFRGIVPAEGGGYRWHDGRRWPPPNVSAFADAVAALGAAADPADVVWIGFSQGAALALSAAAGLPTLGVACLAGYLPPGLTTLRRDLPVFWSHGRRDRSVPVESARAAAATLQSWHVRLEYCETDAGHRVGAACLRALRNWLSGFAAPG